MITATIDLKKKRVLFTWGEGGGLPLSAIGAFTAFGEALVGSGAIAVTGVVPGGRGLAICAPEDGNAWRAEVATGAPMAAVPAEAADALARATAGSPFAAAPFAAAPFAVNQYGVVGVGIPGLLVPLPEPVPASPSAAPWWHEALALVPAALVKSGGDWFIHDSGQPSFGYPTDEIAALAHIQRRLGVSWGGFRGYTLPELVRIQEQVFQLWRTETAAGHRRDDLLLVLRALIPPWTPEAHGSELRFSGSPEQGGISNCNAGVETNLRTCPLCDGHCPGGNA